ncbi:hypothetical protein M514_11341 [Trichuris suis]|uniref:Uncharacterized protein n=1 Tax=Trichuris suis TaxID=68888 RepID=A0A085MTC8_9BILA|nr:hypothetical protein M513_11341 [Trichuris suis]KFD60474.1 hypothetical protein M514_11341 [Trichuris suis]
MHLFLTQQNTLMPHMPFVPDGCTRTPMNAAQRAAWGHRVHYDVRTRHQRPGTKTAGIKISTGPMPCFPVSGQSDGSRAWASVGIGKVDVMEGYICASTPSPG